jgi:hypothetical protein
MWQPHAWQAVRILGRWALLLGSLALIGLAGWLALS